MENRDLLKTKAYHYELPEELIAQYPLSNRSASRLLTLDKNNGEIQHHIFSEIVDYLRSGDVLVLNSSKVIPARLIGKKETGANIEVFLLNPKDDKTWVCLVRPGRKLKPGTLLKFSETLTAKILDYADEGARIIEFYAQSDFMEEIGKVGRVPLPPYINRESELDDKERYQTVYAKENGSVAAPTAGLHFTREILDIVLKKGVQICEVNLHVGLGTFRPVQSDDILAHKMHSEFCTVSKESAEIINKAKKENRRIIAVGTTSVRTMESFAKDGILESGSKWTDIFIYPGKKLQITDALITNFHMPESTLLMLVSAFAGYDNIMSAYSEAVKNRYRFFSYGDAMFIY